MSQIKELLDQIKTNVSLIEQIDKESTSEHEVSGLTDKEIEILREIDIEMLKASFNIEELIQKMFERLKIILGTDHGQLLFPSGDRLVIRYATDNKFIGGSVPIDKSVTGKAYIKKEIQNIPDTSEIDFFNPLLGTLKSEIAVPMIYDETVIGVLNFEAKDENYFTTRHIKLLDLVCGQAADAIKNAQLIKGFNQIMKIEHEILSDSTKTQEQIFKDVLTIAGELINAEYGQLLLYNKEIDMLDIVYSTVPEEIGLQVDHTNSVSGQAFKTKGTIVIPDLDLYRDDDIRYTHGHPEKIGKMKSEISVPIIQMDVAIGILNFESTERHRFKDYEKYILNLFSNQIALILLNSKIIKMNKEINVAKASAVVSDLSVNYAHNLKNHLGACRVWIQEIKGNAAKQLKENPLLKELISDIYIEIEKALGVPRKIMEMNKFNIHEMISTDLEEIINNLVKIMKVTRVRFHVDIEPNFPIVNLPVQFSNVIENALSNSIDAI